MTEKINETIIEVLLGSDDFSTAQQIAELLKLNEKTIRRKIKQINIGLYGFANILSQKGRGYKLIIHDKDKFDEYYDYHIADTELNNPVNRRTAIFEYIVDSGTVTKEDLLEQFFISETTLANDIQEINRMAKSVEVSIISAGKQEFTLRGEEYYIRNTLLRLIYDSGSAKMRRRDSHEFKKRYTDIIRNIFYNKDFYINKHTLDAIVNYVSISARCIKSGRHLLLSDNKLINENNKLFIELSSEILSDIEPIFNVNYSYDEIVFFAYLLKANLPLELLDLEDIINSNEDNFINNVEISMKVLKSIGLKHEAEKQLREDLLRFFYSLELRSKLDIQKREKYYKNMDQMYPHATVISKIIFNQIKTPDIRNVSNEEIVYLSLIINHYFIYSDYSKKRILAIIPSDYTVARIYITEFNRILNCDVDFVAFESYKSMTKEEICLFDMIINPLDQLILSDTEVPVINIHETITVKDVQRIYRILAFSNHKAVIENVKNIEIIHHSSKDSISRKLRLDYHTNVMNSVIGFKKLGKGKGSEYHIDMSGINNKLIFVINSDLTTEGIIDMIKVSYDAIKNLRMFDEVWDYNELQENVR